MPPTPRSSMSTTRAGSLLWRRSRKASLIHKRSPANSVLILQLLVTRLRLRRGRARPDVIRLYVVAIYSKDQKRFCIARHRVCQRSTHTGASRY